MERVVGKLVEKPSRKEVENSLGKQVRRNRTNDTTQLNDKTSEIPINFISTKYAINKMCNNHKNSSVW